MQNISRRSLLLKVGAGAGLLLPIWRTMIPEAMGQESSRKRILFYAGAVSASENHFPKSGGGDSLSLTDGFSALQPYRDEMLFMRGMDVPWHKQLHGPDWFLTGREGTPGGITLDRYIAKEIGNQDPVPSIQLALVGCNSVNNSVSADGRGQVFPAQTDPVKAYANIFGAGLMNSGGGDSTAARLLDERKSLLDFVREDIGKMKSKLAGPEREKLDQYLSSLRDMEGNLSNLVKSQEGGGSNACGNPEAPASFGKPGQKANTAFIDAQIDIAVNALTCGMTSVAVLHKNCSAIYPGGVGEHNLWHGSNNKQKTQYYQYHTGNLAKIRKRLGEVSDGGGSVADKSLIVYFERSGIHHHNGQGDSFLMTIGRAGGYLNTGRHLTFKGRRINDGFISIANAMGVNTNTFGDPKLARGPLPGLTA